MTQTKLFPIAGVLTVVAMVSIGCPMSPPEKPVTRNDHGRPRPSCYRTYDEDEDEDEGIPIPPPQLADGMSAEWHVPVKLNTSVNTNCLEDAIQISACGQQLYFMYAEDLLSELGGAMLSFPNGTYVATRTEGGGPAEFSHPTFYELGLGVDLSLDGKPIFTPDGSKVYFHSNRADNLGYSQGYDDDYLDMYVAPLIDGVPGVAQNLGPPVNSVYPDGEAGLHPDGATLYFASLRPKPPGYPGGAGRGNIWRSTWNGSAWSDPEFLPFPINRPASEQKQPAFATHDGTLYMYFVSDHLVSPYTGLGWIRDPAIYRSTVSESGDLGVPELVIRGIVGEPSLTADGRYLYFVHVLYDADGGFGSNIWYVERKQE